MQADENMLKISKSNGCKCCNNEDIPALFLQLAHQLDSADDHPLLPKRPSKMEPSIESCRQTPPPADTHEKHQSDPASPAPNRASILGAVYDDPAIVHVIEHAEQTYDCHSNSTADSIRRRGATAHETYCPLQCGNRSPPKTCEDRIWQMIAKRVDQQVDTRIRSVFCPSYRDDQKLEELEMATARLDRRLLALEAQTQAARTSLKRRQSMPPAANRHIEDEPESAKRLIALSSQTARLEAEKATLQNTTESLKTALQKQRQDGKQLQRECQSLHQRLTEEQKRSKQLEQQHVEFHKRQTADMLKMDQMQRRIRQLEAEVAQAKLPTPSSSPPSSTQSSEEEEEEEEESVKEEDGYLVFNTNINGELIHCRVKIPSSAATSMRSSPVIRRPADYFPLALVSPPITRAGSPKAALVPPLHQKKKGLNPNAPEWKGL
ncbi:hypothetical protein BJV82DRAFT_664764 [Fennellomyces sp. T-0311]|nr:hypothetical protein BJV82DRAFT_664764 [Fennellomyces sp. T-0311]